MMGLALAISLSRPLFELLDTTGVITPTFIKNVAEHWWSYPTASARDQMEALFANCIAFVGLI